MFSVLLVVFSVISSFNLDMRRLVVGTRMFADTLVVSGPFADLSAITWVAMFGMLATVFSYDCSRKWTLYHSALMILLVALFLGIMITEPMRHQTPVLA